MSGEGSYSHDLKECNSERLCEQSQGLSNVEGAMTESSAGSAGTLFAAQSREFNFSYMLNDDKRRGIIPINNEIEFYFAILLHAIGNTPQPRSFLVVASQWYGHAIRTT